MLTGFFDKIAARLMMNHECNATSAMQITRVRPAHTGRTKRCVVFRALGRGHSPRRSPRSTAPRRRTSPASRRTSRSSCTAGTSTCWPSTRAGRDQLLRQGAQTGRAGVFHELRREAGRAAARDVQGGRPRKVWWDSGPSPWASACCSRCSTTASSPRSSAGSRTPCPTTKRTSDDEGRRGATYDDDERIERLKIKNKNSRSAARVSPKRKAVEILCRCRRMSPFFRAVGARRRRNARHTSSQGSTPGRTRCRARASTPLRAAMWP